MLIEYRRYRILPGRRDAWVEYMANSVVPFQASKGMVVLGQFVAADDSSVFVWVRAFSDADAMLKLREQVYQSEEWVNTIGPEVKKYIELDGVQSEILIPVNVSNQNSEIL